MPLPLFPIGTQPFGSASAQASEEKGLVLFFVMIIIFLAIEDEDGNRCNPLLTKALDMIILFGVATLVTAATPPYPLPPPANRPPRCPENANPPPCMGKPDDTVLQIKSLAGGDAPEDAPAGATEAEEPIAAEPSVCV